MPSLQFKIFNFVLKQINIKQFMVDLSQTSADPTAFQAVVQKTRDNSDVRAPDATLTKGFTHQAIDIDGFDLHLLQQNAPRVMLHLHGGAYVIGPSKDEWKMARDIASRAGYDLAMFGYPKAPEHHCTTTMDKTIESYDHLIARYGAGNVAVTGSSAGGGLAVALTIQLQKMGRPAPLVVVPLYPWLDATLSHREARPIEAQDAVLTCDGLIACGTYYAGELNTQDVRVSPWFASAETLPPLHIFSGTADLLHPEGRDFITKAQTNQQDAHFYSYDQMPHAWMMFPIPESKQARSQVADILRNA